MEETRTLLDAVLSARGGARLRASKALRSLSEAEPAAVYPHFDTLAGLRHHENAILRWNAMLTIGNLARVDVERKIDRLLDGFLAPIGGPHLIDAANTIRAAAMIAAAKPSLADRIAAGILKVERATYATAECRDVAMGHAITALGRIFALLADTRPVTLFVKRQKGNPRPSTRRKAEAFLQKRPRVRTASEMV